MSGQDSEDPRIAELRALGEIAKRPSAVFEATVTSRYPEIPWRKPIDVEIEGRGRGIACRLCIAEFGFSATAGEVFWTFADFTNHLISKHPFYP